MFTRCDLPVKRDDKLDVVTSAGALEGDGGD
jgi:hypothetical protein